MLFWVLEIWERTKYNTPPAAPTALTELTFYLGTGQEKKIKRPFKVSRRKM